MNDYRTKAATNILVVDDNLDILYLLDRFLTNNGYVVRAVSESYLAVEAALSEIPDLVLLDIMMPSPNGWEICSQLKADDRTRDLPVIFLTAKSEVLDKVKAFAAGAVDYITKPFQLEEVLVRVENQLKIWKLQKQLAQQNARLLEEIHDRKLAEIALSKQLRRSNLLRVITDRIRSHIEPEQIFETAAAVVGQAFGSDRAQILFYTDLPTPQLAIAAEYLAKGRAATEVAEIPIRGNPYVQKLLSQESAIATNNVESEPLLQPVQALCFQLRIVSILSVRTSYKGKPNGAIVLQQCDREREWKQDEIELLEAIAAQLGIAIAQAKLLEQEQLARAEQHRQNLQLQQEICHRQQAEAEAAKLLEQLQQVQTLACLGNWEFDVDTQTIICSDQLKKIFGISPQDPDPTPQEYIKHIHRDDRKRWLATVERAMALGEAFEIDFRIIRWDTHLRYINSKGSAIKNQTDRVVRMFGTAMDITERKVLERELALREARLKAFFTCAPVGMAIVDSQVRFLQINELLAQINGASVQDHIGKTLSEILPSFGSKLEPLYQQVYATGKAILNVEVSGEVPSQKGVIRDWMISYFPIFEQENRISSVGAVVVEITDRKRVHSELRSAKERLQHLLATSPAVIYSVKPSVSSKLTFLSDNVTAVLGWETPEFLEDTNFWASHIHPEDAEAVFARMPLLLSKEENVCEYRFLHKDGAYRWVCDRIRLVKDEAGNPIECVGYWVDISDRKLAELALQEIAQREKAIASIIQKMRQTLDFETIFNAVAVELQQVLKCDRTAVFRFNPDWSGNFVAESVAASQSFVVREQNGKPHFRDGYLDHENCSVKTWLNNSKTLTDTYLQETNGRANFYKSNCLVVPDIYSAGFASCYLNTLERLQIRAYVIVPIFCGHKLWGLLASYQNSEPRIWSEAEINIIIQIGTQLGVALQQAELLAQTQKQSAALQQAVIAADTANSAKGEFLAAMSHELRTPLNAILGFTQVMSRDPSLNQQQQEHLGIINRAGEHLLNLINDILEMSKIEAGQTELNLNSFDLIGLLFSLEEMLRLKAQSKNLQLIFDIAADIPQYVQADEGKLRQILINILGNAIKFTQKGSVSLRVRKILETEEDSFESLISNLQISPPSTQLFFEIKDTGPGIAPVEINQIFETFTQTETGKKSQQGTGLGLPISQKFVQLMGGNIAVRSILDRGTAFTFDIPVTLAEERDIHTSKPQQKIIGLAPDQPKYRILVVEDRYENRLLLVALLRTIGFEVREAENGREAIECCFNWEPHLIWMDMRMPVMDGYEATKHIKANLKGQKIAIIAITASAFEEERSLVFSAGCDDFVLKPFRDEAILEMMAKHLEVRYLYQEHSEANDTFVSEKEMLEMGLFLTPQSLATMPENWLAELQKAATELDEKQIFILLDQIRPEHSQIVSALEDLVNNFRFDLIVDLIQEE
ncbi:MAG TPA: response regulator [Kamptonema sp.]|nr:response regulator [Kamptonema sp.]